MFGRATRGYIAYSIGDERLVFLKDGWPPAYKKTRSEFEIYQILRAHDVPNIPHVRYGGNVLDVHGRPQTTNCLTLITRATWCMEDYKLRRLVHHRIVQDIFYPLQSAADEKEFMRAIYNALLGTNIIYFLGAGG